MAHVANEAVCFRCSKVSRKLIDTLQRVNEILLTTILARGRLGAVCGVLRVCALD